MKLSETLLPELDNEMRVTRRVIERVPEDQLGWKPHERSLTMGGLANHLAELPFFAVAILNGAKLDVALPTGTSTVKSASEDSRDKILALFDKNVAAARQTIAGAENESLMESWSLLKAGVPILTLPKIAALRSMLLNHIIHHRGQLTVYLRLTGAKVPPIYGPSADEAF